MENFNFSPATIYSKKVKYGKFGFVYSYMKINSMSGLKLENIHWIHCFFMFLIFRSLICEKLRNWIGYLGFSLLMTNVIESNAKCQSKSLFWNPTHRFKLKPDFSKNTVLIYIFLRTNFQKQNLFNLRFRINIQEKSLQGSNQPWFNPHGSIPTRKINSRSSIFQSECFLMT